MSKGFAASEWILNRDRPQRDYTMSTRGGGGGGGGGGGEEEEEEEEEDI
jgi:hypothetical protein